MGTRRFYHDRPDGFSNPARALRTLKSLRKCKANTEKVLYFRSREPILIYAVVGIAILIAALIIGVFSITIIRDINKLNQAALKISTGDTNVWIDVHRNDEIGELSNSFERMVTSLKITMDVEEG